MPTSEHFGYSDLACHCGGKYCDGGLDQISPVLLSMLEQLRSDIGGIPIKVNCAYRCPEHNAETPGSAPNSQHVQGTAADLAVVSNLTTMEMLWYCQQCRDSEGHRFTGIGCYAYDPEGNTKGDGFIHVDVRGGGYCDDGDVATWFDLG